MINGDRALKIEKQLAQLLDIEVDELRDYLAGNVRDEQHSSDGLSLRPRNARRSLRS
jgi:hypothetical protein